MEPPFPIPNREVKRGSADDSMRATVCENTSSPGQCFQTSASIFFMEQRGSRKFFTTEHGAIYLSRKSGSTPGLFEAANEANRMNEFVIKSLQEGYIPSFIKKDGDIILTIPLFDKDLLKVFWGELTTMTDDEMNETIQKSGLYDNNFQVQS